MGAMRTDTPQPIRLSDYRPPAFLIDEVRLDFDLQPSATRVRARLKVRRNGAAGEPLVLDDPAHCRGSGADAGVERREARAECRAAPARRNAVHHVPDVHGIGRPEADAERDGRRDHPAASPAERQKREPDVHQHEARQENAAMSQPVAETAGKRPRHEDHHG